MLILGAFLWYLPTLQAQAAAGSAYAARIGCSCRYVEGRPLASCKGDFEPGMGMISMVDVPEKSAVRGYVPLLASRTARFSGASGCLLEP